ncbi:MAG: hypothetical protein M3Q07_00155, partial [Pseudobdellovibrionaceae bacterium]|nr:hypothetical protein [Pseudobdellovibrionaceae bacterium]
WRTQHSEKASFFKCEKEQRQGRVRAYSPDSLYGPSLPAKENCVGLKSLQSETIFQRIRHSHASSFRGW